MPGVDSRNPRASRTADADREVGGAEDLPRERLNLPVGSPAQPAEAVLRSLPALTPGVTLWRFLPNRPVGVFVLDED